MARVFLNHKTEEKATVISVRDYLTRCLIDAWLDAEEIVGGSKVHDGILGGITVSRYFMAFISHRYVRSNWCMHELEEAERLALDGKVVIIPVLLDPEERLKLDELPGERANRVRSVLGRYARIEYDRYDAAESARRIAAAVAKHEGIQFHPVMPTTVQGQELQLVRFQITTDRDLPTDVLRGWGLDIEHQFVAHHEGEAKPFRAGKPVALSGRGPCWFYAHLTVPFKNLCPVYVFNNPSQEYICVYDSGKPPALLGTVLKAG